MIHIVSVMANNSSVPYFNWFAEKAQQQNEFRFTFVAMHHERPRMLDEMKAYGCDCYWIPFGKGNKKLEMLKAVRPVYRLLKKIKPDIVHAHLFDDSVPTLIAARLAGIKIRVLTKQDTAFHWFYAPKGVKFDRLNNSNATHIVTISNECRQFVIEKEKADPRKVYMVHNGVPIEFFTKQYDEVKERFREQFQLDGKIVLGTVARLIHWKGHKDIIHAAEQIVKKYPSARFLFIGQGEMQPQLELLVKEKGLENNIIFTGWIERAELPSLYGLMDIYLHAAKWEPFGFVIAEAMMNRVPVVSTDTGAAHDAIVHRENGYLAPYDNIQELVNGVFYMMEHDRKKIGEAGRKAAVDLYNFNAMWKGYTGIYREAFEQVRKK